MHELWFSRYRIQHMHYASTIMSYRRYNKVKKYLHYCDEEKAITNRDHPDYDRLYKVRFLLDKLKDKFRGAFSISQDVSVDECMIPFRGRWSGKSYDASKPIKWGVKVWMACCAKTGYAHNLDVYCGKDADFADLTSINNSAAVVVKLVQDLWGKGYHIYTDRYYTSPYMLHWLRRLDLSATGTCMTNRKGYPKEIVKTQAESRALQQGDFQWVQCQNTGIVATRWTDKKPIYFLTNGYRAEATEPLTVKRRGTKGEELHVPATPSVIAYNKYMGGVDLNDKMARLDKNRKTYKWYNRIDRKCVTWSLYNAYVLYKTNELVRKPMEYRDFVLSVFMAWIGSKTFRRTRPKPAQSNEIRFSREELHCPISVGKSDSRCIVCQQKFAIEKKEGKSYKDQIHKSVKTSMRCATCDVALCIKKDSTCWLDWHTKVEYWR